MPTFDKRLARLRVAAESLHEVLRTLVAERQKDPEYMDHLDASGDSPSDVIYYSTKDAMNHLHGRYTPSERRYIEDLLAIWYFEEYNVNPLGPVSDE